MTALADTLNRITVADLRRRGGLKWTYAGPDVLGAFVAEMDFGTAPAVEAALRAVIARQDYGYLTPRAARQMAVACAAWLTEGSGWEVDPDWVRPLPDVIKGLEAAITLFSRPDSPVILPTPAYMPFLSVPPLLGRKIIQVPMTTVDGRAGLDLDGIGAAFRAGGHLLILCNPCNPIGRVYTQAELAGVGEVVERHGGRVFADEIHAPLVYPGHRYIPYASLSEVTAGHTLTATSASKGWNLPGLKCAQLILGHEADRELWAEAGRSSSTARAPPACTPTSPRSPQARTGSRRCWPTSTGAGCCSVTCSPSTFPRSATGLRKARTWPGWIAASWAWVTALASSSWTRGRYWSTTGPRSVRRERVTSGSTSPPPGRSSRGSSARWGRLWPTTDRDFSPRPDARWAP